MTARGLFAADALLPTGWARDVLLEWDDQGRFAAVTAGAHQPLDIARADGPVIAGMPNLHSHAFQRVFGGLTEFRGTLESVLYDSGATRDNFWSWRELMYRVAGAVTPEQLEAIATWLYIEMLEAGYTSVCEFHYIHHDTNGTPYADDATLALCLLRAAERTGVGMTLLPVLYQTGGFGGVPPGAGQRRFIRSTDSLLSLIERLQPLCVAQGARVGLAAHSLRAVPPESLRAALAGLDAIDATAPVHIHIAEQMQEVADCLTWSGQRPVEWLLDHAPVGARWCLVHATHMTPVEARRAARTGAVAGLCPTTEANLGDGVFDLPAWLDAETDRRGRWGVGSDSHVAVNAAEELLTLEYSQRLNLHRRNIAASDEHPEVATAMMLEAVTGGAQASALSNAGLTAGQRADFAVLNARHPLIAGLSAPQMLSAHVFASHRTSALDAVYVGGRPLVTAGIHTQRESAAAGFIAARAQLLSAV